MHTQARAQMSYRVHKMNTATVRFEIGSNSSEVDHHTNIPLIPLMMNSSKVRYVNSIHYGQFQILLWLCSLILKCPSFRFSLSLESHFFPPFEFKIICNLGSPHARRRLASQGETHEMVAAFVPRARRGRQRQTCPRFPEKTTWPPRSRGEEPSAKDARWQSRPYGHLPDGDQCTA